MAESLHKNCDLHELETRKVVLAFINNYILLCGTFLSDKYVSCDPISSLFYIFISDERDAIQKKTFTKWANKHLKKVRTAFSHSLILSITRQNFHKKKLNK